MYRDLLLGQVLALRGHCVGTACILRTQRLEAGILTQITLLVVTVIFPRNPFQPNEQSKNIRLFMEALFVYPPPLAQAR